MGTITHDYRSTVLGRKSRELSKINGGRDQREKHPFTTVDLAIETLVCVAAWFSLRQLADAIRALVRVEQPSLPITHSKTAGHRRSGTAHSECLGHTKAKSTYGLRLQTMVRKA